MTLLSRRDQTEDNGPPISPILNGTEANCDPVRRGAISQAVSWGRIEGIADRVAIVANGPSAQHLDLRLIERAIEAGVHVIAINGAIEWMPAATSWLTIDPSPKNRPLMRNQKPGVKYYAAVPDDYGKPDAEKVPHRAPPEPNVIYLRRIIVRVRPGFAFSECPDRLWSGNSAFAALGMAYLMDAKRIAMIGVDGTGIGYSHGQRGNPGRMWHMRSLFAATVRQLNDRGIQVRNGSPCSRITCFRREDPNSAMKWICG